MVDGVWSEIANLNRVVVGRRVELPKTVEEEVIGRSGLIRQEWNELDDIVADRQLGTAVTRVRE